MNQGESSTSGLEIAQADSGAPQEIGSEVPPGADLIFPPHGFVHLQEAVASDLLAVNAARVSFRKESDWELSEEDEEIREVLRGLLEQWGLDVPSSWEAARGKISDVDEKVLRFLVRNRHGTPFEHTYFRFHVRAPIFVFREWHRHRIGVSINEESARYVELKPDFYVPQGDALRRQTDKPGRYKFEPIDDDIVKRSIENEFSDLYHDAYETYQSLLSLGLAKEVARAVLPVGIYSQMIWTCNARSLMSFLSLRNADTALFEIREMAAAMERKFAELMPVTWDEFVKNGRMAP